MLAEHLQQARGALDDLERRLHAAMHKRLAEAAEAETAIGAGIAKVARAEAESDAGSVLDPTTHGGGPFSVWWDRADDGMSMRRGEYRTLAQALRVACIAEHGACPNVVIRSAMGRTMAATAPTIETAYPVDDDNADHPGPDALRRAAASLSVRLIDRRAAQIQREIRRDLDEGYIDPAVFQRRTG